MQAFVADNHYNLSDDYFAIFRFIGTEGVITGTLGAMYNYPQAGPTPWSGAAGATIPTNGSRRSWKASGSPIRSSAPRRR